MVVVISETLHELLDFLEKAGKDQSEREKKHAEKAQHRQRYLQLYALILLEIDDFPSFIKTPFIIWHENRPLLKEIRLFRSCHELRQYCTHVVVLKQVQRVQPCLTEVPALHYRVTKVRLTAILLFYL